MDRRQWNLLRRVLMAGLLSLAACSGKGSPADAGPTDAGGDAGKDAGVDAGPADAGSPPKATFRLLHAVADSSTTKFDVYVRSMTMPTTSVATGVAYNGASDPIQVSPGFYNIELRPSGSPATSAAVLQTPFVNLTTDMSTTFIAAGLLSNADPAKSARILVIKDVFDLPDNISTQIRVVNASPDSVALSASTGGDGAFNVKPLAPFAVSPAGGFPVPATAFAVRLGTGTPPAQTLATFPTISTSPCILWNYVVITGLYGGKPQKDSSLTEVLLPATGPAVSIKQNPVFYGLNLSSDQPAVDAFFTSTFDNPVAVPNSNCDATPDAGIPTDAGTPGDAGTVDAGTPPPPQPPPPTIAKLLSQLRPEMLGGPISLPPADHLKIDFYPHSGSLTPPTATPLASVTVDHVVAQQNYLVMLSGSGLAATPTINAKIVQEGFSPDASNPTNTLVRLYDAASNWGSLTLVDTDGTAFAQGKFTNVAYGSDSGAAGVSTTPKNVHIGVTGTQGTTTQLVFTTALLPSQTVFLIPVDNASVTPPQSLLLLDTTQPRWLLSVLAADVVLPN
jgi:hypothetical protein